MAFILRRPTQQRKLFSAALSCYSNAATTKPHHRVDDVLSSCVQQLVRLYSRPRGTLWRGRKGIGKEALHVIGELKRVKNDKIQLGNIIQHKAARLLKVDLLAVLTELQRQEEVDLAFKVFKMVRKEVWYKPDVYLYKDMLSCLAKAKRVSECQVVLQASKVEGLPPDGLILTEVMMAYLECGMLPQAMETFDAMRRGSCPPDLPAFKVLLRYLKKMNKKDLREKIRRECLEFYEGIVPNDRKKSSITDDESDEEKEEEDDVFNLAMCEEGKRGYDMGSTSDEESDGRDRESGRIGHEIDTASYDDGSAWTSEESDDEELEGDKE